MSAASAASPRRLHPQPATTRPASWRSSCARRSGAPSQPAGRPEELAGLGSAPAIHSPFVPAAASPMPEPSIPSGRASLQDVVGHRPFARTEPAPASGVSPILLHHGRHDSAADYYYLARPASSRPAPAHAPGVVPGSFEPPALPRRAVPALPAARPVTGGAPIPSAFDVHDVRRDFPALHQDVNGHPLVWLDNAATTQKPQSVIDATSEFYSRHNSNIHRAAHTLAARSTDLFKGARDKLRDFVGAASSREIVFLRGTTEADQPLGQQLRAGEHRAWRRDHRHPH